LPWSKDAGFRGCGGWFPVKTREGTDFSRAGAIVAAKSNEDRFGFGITLQIEESFDKAKRPAEILGSSTTW